MAFAATQAGVISINLRTKKTELRHKTENIRSVAIYDGKLYILSDNQLTIEGFNGADSKTFSLPQSVLSFIKQVQLTILLLHPAFCYQTT